MHVTVKIKVLVLHFLEEIGSNATKLNSSSDIKLSKLGCEIASVTFLLHVCMGSGKSKMIADAKFQNRLDLLCFSEITQLLMYFTLSGLYWILSSTSRTDFY